MLVVAPFHAVLLSFHRRHFSNGLRLHGDLVMRHKCAQHALELQTNGIHAKWNVIVAKQTESERKRHTNTSTHALARACHNDNNNTSKKNRTVCGSEAGRTYAHTKRSPL